MSLEAHSQEQDTRDALNRALRQLAQARKRNEELIKAAMQAAQDAILALGPSQVTPSPKQDKRRHPEAALWHMTDWQGSKKTASYDTPTMRKRVMLFCDKAEEITEIQRSHHPVRTCVIAFGGDMLEGLFNFPTQPFEIDATLFDQIATVSLLEADVVRRALAIYERVIVVPEWGNHGRIGSKRSAVPRNDNSDRIAYELAKTHLKAEDRLTWQPCPEDIQRIEIGNYRALLIHGDEIGRNGYASPATIVQHVNRWRSGAYPWEFRDCMVGHYHSHAEWPLANGIGAVYQTGSTESDNRYAMEGMAASARPSQRLHFIEPEKGAVTAQYKIWLD